MIRSDFTTTRSEPRSGGFAPLRSPMAVTHSNPNMHTKTMKAVGFARNNVCRILNVHRRLDRIKLRTPTSWWIQRCATTHVRHLSLVITCECFTVALRVQPCSKSLLGKDYVFSLSSIMFYQLTTLFEPFFPMPCAELHLGMSWAPQPDGHDQATLSGTVPHCENETAPSTVPGSPRQIRVWPQAPGRARGRRISLASQRQEVLKLQITGFSATKSTG